jgi:UDP-glucose 4-epimerase
MNIIFTGSSSFTGYWFIRTLSEAGHDVIATFKGSRNRYQDIRKKRVEELIKIVPCVFDCGFGSEEFIHVIENTNNIDLLCHHDADVTNYKSSDFNVVSAVQNNTNNVKTVLQKICDKQCHHLVLTGSVFEYNEGAGSGRLRSFSPYALSKGLTAEVFRYYTEVIGMIMGKFVIPNPFGPYEESRFTAYLINAWREGKTPRVATPDYVRDNIHVSLLSKAYNWFVGNLIKSQSVTTIHPSGYPEAQGSFATRFAKEMSKRLDLDCHLDFAEQQFFPEPEVRINTDLVKNIITDWNEKKAWDELADYYIRLFIK